MTARLTTRAQAVCATPYMVGGEYLAVEWRWPDGQAVWSMSCKEDGIKWEACGELSPRGREMLLAHFGLEDVAERLPLARLRTMSPAALHEKRRKLEERAALAQLTPTSHCPGQHIPAAIAA